MATYSGKQAKVIIAGAEYRILQWAVGDGRATLNLHEPLHGALEPGTVVHADIDFAESVLKVSGQVESVDYFKQGDGLSVELCILLDAEPLHVKFVPDEADFVEGDGATQPIGISTASPVAVPEAAMPNKPETPPVEPIPLGGRRMITLEE